MDCSPAHHRQQSRIHAWFEGSEGRVTTNVFQFLFPILRIIGCWIYVTTSIRTREMKTLDERLVSNQANLNVLQCCIHGAIINNQQSAMTKFCGRINHLVYELTNSTPHTVPNSNQVFVCLCVWHTKHAATIAAGLYHVASTAYHGTKLLILD